MYPVTGACFTRAAVRALGRVVAELEATEFNVTEELGYWEGLKYWEGEVFLDACRYTVGHHDDLVLSNCLRKADVHETPLMLDDLEVQKAFSNQPLPCVEHWAHARNKPTGRETISKYVVSVHGYKDAATILHADAFLNGRVDCDWFGETIAGERPVVWSP